MQEKAHTMKEEVREILVAVAAASSCDDDLVQKLELVDTLQRLGPWSGLPLQEGN
jgi:hypothetical protein